MVFGIWLLITVWLSLCYKESDGEGVRGVAKSQQPSPHPPPLQLTKGTYSSQGGTNMSDGPWCGITILTRALAQAICQLISAILWKVPLAALTEEQAVLVGGLGLQQGSTLTMEEMELAVAAFQARFCLWLGSSSC